MKYLINKIFSLTIGLFKKSNLDSATMQTPNSPPTFNLNIDQLNEIQVISDRGEFIKSGKICYPRKYPMRSTDEPISEYSNFDFYFLAKDFTANSIENIQESEYSNLDYLIEKMDELSIFQELVNNSSNINCPLEYSDLYFNTSILDLIDITNLISNF